MGHQCALVTSRDSPGLKFFQQALLRNDSEKRVRFSKEIILKIIYHLKGLKKYTVEP